MTRTITGSYDASLQNRNDKDDLIASGIEREIVEIMNTLTLAAASRAEKSHRNSAKK